MATVESSIAQIFDKLADLVVGPVCGTVTTSATSEVVVEQGTMATLTGGRRVRVRKSTRIYANSSAPIPVRLEWLSPAFPAAANFAAVAAGTTATWIDPPTGLNGTGTTSEFASGVLSTGLKIGSVVEAERLAEDVDLFAAGANGTTSLILLEPSLATLGGLHHYEMSFFDVTWKLRVNIATLAPAKDARALGRSVFDKLCAVLQGATVGDDVAWFRKYAPVKRTNVSHSWELEFTTRLATEGRVLQDVFQTGGDFDEASATITLPDDGAQPSPFRVSQIVDVNP